MENIFRTRIDELRQLMAKKDIDLYYIPMDDCHNSEYVGEHFKTIEFISGFTGSAAQVIVTRDESFLWTDGRYFLQADEELKGSGIGLMKYGEDGVVEPHEFINEKLSKDQTVGFDGKVVNCEFANKLNTKIKYDEDLVDLIWKERPVQKFTDIKIFEKQSGRSAVRKIEKLRMILKEQAGKEYVHIINSLDDIAWLLNIRAKDVEHNPAAYGYLSITENTCNFYSEAKVSDQVKGYFDSIGVAIKSYKDFQKNVLQAASGFSNPLVILDLKRISFDMLTDIKAAGYEVRDIENPTSFEKALKNEVEIKNTIEAHRKDGVALVKFMKWIKERAGKEEISECDVADKLVEFRSEQEGFLEPSFATIAGYLDNAAIIHYEPVRGKDKQITDKGMLLVDSGGHYEEGTTDTTRTFILGEISPEEKKCFTLVAAAMLRLLDFNERNAKSCFNGLEGDAVARELLHEHGYDYNHGTGHGIGYVLNVHETPPSISKKAGGVAEKIFEPGMIMSDEPGIYVDGAFGIRTENNMLVTTKEDEAGSYMAFENLTMVPIDIDGIDAALLDAEDIDRLNNYNELVYNAISDRLDEETREWLRKYTDKV